MKTSLIRLFVLVNAALLFSGCDESSGPTQGPALRTGSTVMVQIVLPANAGVALRQAADDMMTAFRTVTGATENLPVSIGGAPSHAAGSAILVRLKKDELLAIGEEGFFIETGVMKAGRPALYVQAETEQGAAYGLYRILQDLGVEYIHPEETFFPDKPEAQLPWAVYRNGFREKPLFAMRGFHEHTQHPIPMSDFLLRPGSQEFRDFVSHYLLWLARNRQNTLFFLMLKTVDMDTWLPYIRGIVEEAHSMGVKVGACISFADQQQNAFKLIREDNLNSFTGQPYADEVQIRQGIDRMLEGRFDYLEFQIATSEFTTTPDATVLGWIQTAVDHVRPNHPGVRIFGWIHTYCDSKAEDGSYYFHLPLRSDPFFGAFAHTTMFYDMFHPAPVYRCEDFSHQWEFMLQAAGQRELVFFPETAWWLGFDNNLPIPLPITGYSRWNDILQIASRLGGQVSGHVTFTTGREWTYWQYDHYLTKATWQSPGRFGWKEYLDEIAPLYGALGSQVADITQRWTDLQVRHFYEENPDLYFYIAGEHPEDAAEISRPMHPLYADILRLDDAAYAAWRTTEYDQLLSMKNEYRELLAAIPVMLSTGSAQQRDLYDEWYASYTMYIRRFEHVLATYGGTIAAREWDQEKKAAAAEGREPDEGIRSRTEAQAETALQTAKSITDTVLSEVAAREEYYRYPAELLAGEKSESLTAYPFGYLNETRRGAFWTNRDDELERLIHAVFQAVEEWSETPDQVYEAQSSDIRVVYPTHPLAGLVLRSFLPTFLFGLTGYDDGTGAMTVLLALDYNDNQLPDSGTEAAFAGIVTGNTFTSQGGELSLPVRNSSGAELGILTLYNPVLTLDLTLGGGQIAEALLANISAQFATENLVGIVLQLGGYDEQGLRTILKQLFGIPSDQPLPDYLPIEMEFALHRVG